MVESGGGDFDRNYGITNYNELLTKNGNVGRWWLTDVIVDRGAFQRERIHENGISWFGLFMEHREIMQMLEVEEKKEEKDLEEFCYRRFGGKKFERKF